MRKIDLGPWSSVYPMPVTLVGADIPSGPTFKAVAWVTPVQLRPARLVIGVNRAHATSAGILEHGQFSVCQPDVDMVAVTDWCGIRSAHEGVDKAAPFTVFRGSLEHAPMIAECPLCQECRVIEVMDLSTHAVIAADIVGTWTEDRFLADGMPDIRKLRPFTLTEPDNRYWSVGEHIGDAYSAGRHLRP